VIPVNPENPLSPAASAAGMPTPPSGRQTTLRHGDQEAVVTEVGASLRVYTSGGHDVIDPFPLDAIAPVSHGAVLAPWPNRLGDGKYTFDGGEHQVPITEPARGNALHGLVCWQRFSVVARETTDAHDVVELGLDLVPTSGYPFRLSLVLRYELGDAGLRVTTTARNDGTTPAPYGLGFHPWLSTRGAAVDDCRLSVGETTHVTVDDRLLPTGTEPSEGQHALVGGRDLVGVDLDDAYVDVVRDGGGLSWGVLSAPDGHASAVWMDAAFEAWQVCTGDHLEPPYVRTAVAVEPMTCCADAFRTGERLVVLAPGAEHRATWGLTLL
jgi:aldose 1-epimerase